MLAWALFRTRTWHRNWASHDERFRERAVNTGCMDLKLSIGISSLWGSSLTPNLDGVLALVKRLLAQHVGFGKSQLHTINGSLSKVSRQLGPRP